ncbi:hypothetical protein CSIM01_09132 [Colletotrichum simmondsii]|uniref:Uncharacterized protein n=1 Tax=Colletotrichum simmondsii TaxID=703756 RepID=A0A135TWP2_9PEZI|nr:hypothetical protein CSIM01_09132 [Colletotrichum simmondsii]
MHDTRFKSRVFFLPATLPRPGVGRERERKFWPPGHTRVRSDLRVVEDSDEYDESNDENRGPCCTSDERFGSLPGRLSPNLLFTTQDSQSHQAISAEGVPLICQSRIRKNGQSQVQEDRIRQEETVPERPAKTKMYRVHRRVAMQDVPSTPEAINEAPKRAQGVSPRQNIFPRVDELQKHRSTSSLPTPSSKHWHYSTMPDTIVCRSIGTLPSAYPITPIIPVALIPLPVVPVPIPAVTIPIPIFPVPLPS